MNGRGKSAVGGYNFHEEPQRSCPLSSVTDILIKITDGAGSLYEAIFRIEANQDAVYREVFITWLANTLGPRRIWTTMLTNITM